MRASESQPSRATRTGFHVVVNKAWVLKNPVIRPTLLERVWVLLNSWFSFLGGDSQRCCWLAEEAHQSLDVLRSRCQEELLADEFHATQAQAS
jgi:hypothetical protein